MHGQSHPFDGAQKVTRPISLDRQRRMRNVIRAAVALVILVALYSGWALVGAAQLASAAQRSDTTPVIERVDLQALIRSLSGGSPQRIGTSNNSTASAGRLINASAAEMPPRALLMPANIAAFLSQGAWARRPPCDQGCAFVLGMPSLGQAFNALPPTGDYALAFDGPRNFVVGLDSSDGRYRIQHQPFPAAPGACRASISPSRSRRGLRISSRRGSAERWTCVAIKPATGLTEGARDQPPTIEALIALSIDLVQTGLDRGVIR